MVLMGSCFGLLKGGIIVGTAKLGRQTKKQVNLGSYIFFRFPEGLVFKAAWGKKI